MIRRHWKWLLLVLVLVLAGAAAVRGLSARKAQQAAAVAPAPVQALELAASDVVRATVQELSQGLPISGTVKAVNSAQVKARAAGELQGLTLREGDAVQAGQVIGRIDSADARARLRQAQDQADSARSQVEIAQRQFDNNQALVNQGFISKTALDTSQNNLQAARSNHQAALATVEVARKAVEDTVLRAPISGVVAQRLAQPGERVGIDAKVLEIVDLRLLELEATLGAGDSVLVQVGQAALLQIEGSSQPVQARVARINPTAQAGSRNVLAYLAIAQPQGLRQGLFAQGTLATGRTSALAVPLAAVRTDKPAPYVQTIENGQVAHRSVETGLRGRVGEDTLVAVKGLTDGAVVLRGHLGTLREGTPVRFTTPVAAPSGLAPKP